MVIKPLTLLAGREIVLRDEAIKKISDQIFPPPADAGINTSKCNASKDSLAGILDQAITAPFLANHRLIIIDHIESLKAANQKLLLSAIENSPKSTIWVLMTDDRKAKKNAFMKKLTASSEMIECEASYKDLEVKRWVANRFKDQQKAVEPSVIDLLLRKVGKNLTVLAASVEQLVVMADGKEKVTLQDAHALLGEIADQNIYELYEALKTNKLDKALQILRDLKLKGSRSYEIIASLVWQFDRQLKIKNMLGRGLTANDVAKELGVHPYVAELNCRVVSRIYKDSMMNDLSIIYNCDRQIKRGIMSEDIAMESCILSLNLS